MTLVKFNNGVKNSTLKPWFSDVFDTFLNDSYNVERFNAKVPAVNISETDNAFVLELAAPGFKKEDFKIDLEKNILQVSSEKKTSQTAEEKKYSRKEYSYSSFSRSFTLPETADFSKIEAKYEDGILVINIAKQEDTKPVARQISIA